MRHSSIKLEQPIKLINIVPQNPYISKCEIKVCYVSDEPNRNKSIITKETATQMANSLPGCPIVGFYNENKGDFEEHEREIQISKGKFKIIDKTRPYGFVDLNAKVWFQKFLDDNTVEREYLMTEGWLWTGQYPECNRVIEEGNNHSMELGEDYLDAFWTKDNKGLPEFFIINEAIISKLCILGDEEEPCFEGSTIKKPTIEFSFDDNFKNELNQMMKEIRELLNKGGEKVFSRYSVEIGDALWTALYSYIENNLPQMTIEGIFQDDKIFAVLKNDEEYVRLNCSLDSETNTYSFSETEVIEYTPEENPQFTEEAISEYKMKKDKEKKDKEEQDKENKPDNKTDNNPDSDSEDEDDEEEKDKKKKKEEYACGGGGNSDSKKKKKKYVLEEVEEYTELLNRYNTLETTYNALKSDNDNLNNELASLREFKANIEKKDKKAMIDSFYMLSEEDKQDVINNIDTYSLDDIEAKLSIICVRNKVNFNLDNDNTNQKLTTFNLNDSDDDSTPAWVKRAMSVAKTLN